MLEIFSQAGKEARRDIVFIIVIHLLLLSLYAVVYHHLPHNHLDINPHYILTKINGTLGL